MAGRLAKYISKAPDLVERALLHLCQLQGRTFEESVPLGDGWTDSEVFTVVVEALQLGGRLLHQARLPGNTSSKTRSQVLAYALEHGELRVRHGGRGPDDRTTQMERFLAARGWTERVEIYRGGDVSLRWRPPLEKCRTCPRFLRCHLGAT